MKQFTAKHAYMRQYRNVVSGLFSMAWERWVLFRRSVSKAYDKVVSHDNQACDSQHETIIRHSLVLEMKVKVY